MYQWVTRDVFWNPGIIVGNAYAPFFRVNSVFWDPSIYGRYLAVAILVTLAGIVLGGVRGLRSVGLYVVVVAIWIGLVFSYSQSSFIALATGVVVSAAVAWGRRAVVGLVALGLLAAVVGLAAPQVRHEITGKSGRGLNKITSGRSNLVSQGIHIAVEHPVVGIGVGGFRRAYAERTGVKGTDPKRVASHTMPITVAAEGGIVGLALLCWLDRRGTRGDVAPARGRLHLADVARDRRRPRRDHRAQLLLRRVLRGPAHVVPARTDRCRRARAQEAGPAGRRERRGATRRRRSGSPGGMTATGTQTMLAR